MQRTTFSVLFYIRRTKLTREGEAPVLLRLTVNGIRTDVYVKKTIVPALWNTAKGKANEKNHYCKELNLYLDAVKLRLMKLQRKMELDGLQVTAHSLIDRYLGKDQQKRYTLMEVFREHNEKCRKLAGIDMAPATVTRYETSLKHTLEFMRHTYRKDTKSYLLGKTTLFNYMYRSTDAFNSSGTLIMLGLNTIASESIRSIC